MLNRIRSVPPSAQVHSAAVDGVGAAGMPSRAALTLSAHGGPPCCRVRLRGDLDIATAPVLETLAGRLYETGVRRLVVDLSGIEFLAVAGMHVLAHLDHRFRADDGQVVLVRPPACARRLLRISGLDAELTVRPRSARPPEHRCCRDERPAPNL